VLRAHIDISRDLDGDTVVLACIDLIEEDVRASAHAVRAVVEQRFRVPAISGSEALELRDLTSLADGLGAPGAQGAVRTLVFGAARLNVLRESLAVFVASRDEAEWIPDGDREPLARARELLPRLCELCEEALRAAESPLPRVV
jgi:hypothetical protein